MKGATMETTTPTNPNSAGTQPLVGPVDQAVDLGELFPGRYLSVTSFKRDGTGVATPVWFVSDGSRLFAFTDLQSPKIRRIRRDPLVLVASCRVDGKLRDEPVAAHAEVLTATADLERVHSLLLARYPISYRIVMLVYRLGRRLRGKQSVAAGAALAITIEQHGPRGFPASSRHRTTVGARTGEWEPWTAKFHTTR
jgi:PPOX class probable F420-dependent enzyme